MKIGNRQKKPRVKKMRRINTWVLTIGSVLFVVLVGIVAWLQLRKYEDGVMEVYAVQQDGYVQLVLDQINLVPDRGNDEIVENILATLDASSNRYWTLSDSEALIFVKDIVETNRYKGFTTETYYGTESAREFLDGLKTSRVTHETIQMDGRLFIASGVRFAYNGQRYCICLLTNADVVLDQNAYLSAKINLSVLAAVVLATIVVVGLIIAGIAESWYQRYRAVTGDNAELRASIERLNEALSQDILFNTQHMAFEVNALPAVLEKLETRDVWPLEMMIMRCDGKTTLDEFLSNAQVAFDKKTMRVILSDTDVLLLIIKGPELDDEAIHEVTDNLGARLMNRTTITEAPDRYLEAIFVKLYRQVEEDGK